MRLAGEGRPPQCRRSSYGRSSSLALNILRRQLGRQPGIGRRGSWLRQPPATDVLLGIWSPAGFPCPESSPSFNAQFSRFAGDGHYLAFGTELGTLTILDTRVEATSAIQDPGALIGEPRMVDVGGGEGESGRRSSSVVAEWRALMNCVFDLEWLHGDRQIGLAGGDNTCRLQDTETQTEICVFEGHRGSVKCISGNPVQQSVLLTGSRDGSFALWDARVARRGAQCNGYHSALGGDGASRTSTCFPLEQVVSAHPVGMHASKRPWALSDVPQGSLAPTPIRNHCVTAVAWLGDGEHFLTAGQDGLVKLWDTRYALQPLSAHDPLPTPKTTRCNVNTSNHGNSRDSIATSSPSTPTRLRGGGICSLRTSQTCVGWSQGDERSTESQVGASVGSARRRGRGSGGKGTGRHKKGLWRERVRGGEVVASEGSSTTSDRRYGISSLDTSEDGGRVAVCTVKNQVAVYSYSGGTLKLSGHYTGNGNSSSFYVRATLSPDGSLLASGSTTDTPCVWEVDRPGAPIVRLMGHANEVTGVTWCRSEAFKLATCSDDETVRVWALGRGRSHAANLPSRNGSLPPAFQGRQYPAGDLRRGLVANPGRHHGTHAGATPRAGGMVGRRGVGREFAIGQGWNREEDGVRGEILGEMWEGFGKFGPGRALPVESGRRVEKGQCSMSSPSPPETPVAAPVAVRDEGTGSGPQPMEGDLEDMGRMDRQVVSRREAGLGLSPRVERRSVTDPGAGSRTRRLERGGSEPFVVRSILGYSGGRDGVGGHLSPLRPLSLTNTRFQMAIQQGEDQNDENNQRSAPGRGLNATLAEEQVLGHSTQYPRSVVGIHSRDEDVEVEQGHDQRRQRRGERTDSEDQSSSLVQGQNSCPRRNLVLVQRSRGRGRGRGSGRNRGLRYRQGRSGVTSIQPGDEKRSGPKAGSLHQQSLLALWSGGGSSDMRGEDGGC